MRLTEFLPPTLRKTLVPVAALALSVFMGGAAMAAPIANPIATFAGLDKITGRITKFDVYIDETVLFGALEVTPRACYSRPPTETQRISAFLEVDQRSLQGNSKRIFTGWMFADSPALNALDHAVYDIWLIECKTTSTVPPPGSRATPEASGPAQ
ncbi:hypothetical protein ABIB57_000950 [Devosia sp. UYZn731]